jgi:hypothetical protein
MASELVEEDGHAVDRPTRGEVRLDLLRRRGIVDLRCRGQRLAHTEKSRGGKGWGDGEYVT